jgi:release factor glutamine methyltransferase
MTAAALLHAASQRLAAAGIETAHLDAEVLLAHVLGLGRAALYAHLETPVAADAAARFDALLARRLRREPIAYLTGEQEFWSLPFAVTPDVLIPRPETEMLVEVGLTLLRAPLAQRSGAGAGIPTRPQVLDIGTGSGCVAVAVARELPDVRVTAVDISPAALVAARGNAERHGVAARVTFIESDLYAALPAGATFDVILANPPYLAPGDAVSPEVAFEPQSALLAGADGLDVIRRLIAGAAAHLHPGGWLLMELGAGQAEAVRTLVAAAGLTATRIAPDLAGIPRLLVAQRPGTATGG